MNWYISLYLVSPSLDLPVISHAAWRAEVSPEIRSAALPKTSLSGVALPGNGGSGVFTTGPATTENHSWNSANDDDFDAE